MMSAASFKRFGFMTVAACFIAITLIADQAHADSSGGADEGPDESGISEGFSIGFANTYGYDYCGDADIGDRLRKVWWRILDYCDLSTHQRSVIRKNFEYATQTIPAQIPEMRKQWTLPADPDSEEEESRDFYGLFRCGQDSYRKKKAKMESVLDEIEQENARPDAIFTDRCTE